MSKHDEFVTVVNTLKAASPTISTEQRVGLLREAVQQHGLSVDEASKILDASGLIIGEKVNYFEILGLSMEALQNGSEVDSVSQIDAAHQQRYNASLRAGGRVRSDGRTEDQWRVLLNHARDTLKDPQSRQAHITELQREKDNKSLEGNVPPIFKFPNGAEATSIPQLADLMAENSKEATDALYRGYLEQSLGRAGEMHFATAARATAKEFPNDPELGLKAMVEILRGKMAFQEGIETSMPQRLGQKMEVEKQNEAATPKQLARMIDRNWEQAKRLLYNGFMTLWFEYTIQPQFADIAKKITTRYNTDQDIGLEVLVQELDPHIGQPELEISHTHIDFGKVDAEARKIIQLEIKNVGRGFLYGDVELATELPGFQVSASAIRGAARLTVALDAKHLAVKRKHEIPLAIRTNGGNPLKVPITCYVDYLISESIRRVLISSAAVATIALVTRLIILLLEDSGWLGTHLTGTHFTTWRDYWQQSWTEWSDSWLWINWKVYTLKTPRSGFGFIPALASLGIGIFAYWFFFFRKEGIRGSLRILRRTLPGFFFFRKKGIR